MREALAPLVQIPGNLIRLIPPGLSAWTGGRDHPPPRLLDRRELVGGRENRLVAAWLTYRVFSEDI